MNQVPSVPTNLQLSLGQCAAIACTLEATIPKPGNVHRSADFEDCTFTDFLLSAHAIARPFDLANELTTGQLVLQSVQATRQLVSTNTNLGLILLMAPLAKSQLVHPEYRITQQNAYEVLQHLTTDDASDVFEAIRLAQPGGMGSAAEYDINEQQIPATLLAAMRAASDRDLIAAQYVNGYEQLFKCIVPSLQRSQAKKESIVDYVIRTFLEFLAEYPDSLIARKLGVEFSKQVSCRAAGVLAVGEGDNPDYLQALSDFDFWLRSDGNRRNPGTTADFIGAGLFVCLCNQTIIPPF